MFVVAASAAEFTDQQFKQIVHDWGDCPIGGGRRGRGTLVSHLQRHSTCAVHRTAHDGHGHDVAIGLLLLD